jgi:hypothetical protein
MNFDKKRVICISLKSHNQQQLFSIAEKYLISFESLVQIKEEGYLKIWVESNGDFAIAVSHESDPGRMVIKENYNPLTKKDYEFLKNLKPVKVPKMPKNQSAKVNYKEFLKEGFNIKTKSMDVSTGLVKNVNVVLDLDTILDKINQSGIGSITKKEKDFLDNLSKQ